MANDQDIIILEGFQTFKDRVEIPYGRLTFLFGPNSVGKSAVYDGLELASHMYHRSYSGNYKYPDDVHERFERVVQKGWRKTAQERKRSSYSERMVIGIQQKIFVNMYSIASESDYLPESKDRENRDYIEDNGASIRLISTFHSLAFEADYADIYGEYRGNHPASDVVCNRDFKVIYDNEIFTELLEQKEFSINLNHGIFEGYTEKNGLSKLSTERPDKFSFENGVFKCHGDYIVLEANKRFCLDIFSGFHLDSGLTTSQENVLKTIIDIYDKFIETVLGSIDIGARLVEASRKIPTERELTINIPADPYEFYQHETLLEKYHFGSKHTKEYSGLAASFAKSLSPRKNEKEERDLPHNNINRYLSDYMFLDRGYQIDFDYLTILTSEQFEYISEDFESNYPNAYELIIQIYLRDENNIKLNFEDVGSGLGYVLPILNELSSNSSCDVFIQQPELHLHPALQAAMGDVIIDASASKRVIVETHSEHLLLRVLRRIRNSTNGNLPDDKLNIEGKDLSVLYFDRVAEGATTVKQLRVSSDGEFMDRWPNGFFEERDQELFDE